MSKYLPLWEYIAGPGTEKAVMTYREIGEILGFAIDHSFLNSKKELNGYGWAVKKISMKEETVLFEKLTLPVHDNISNDPVFGPIRYIFFTGECFLIRYTTTDPVL